MTNIKLSRVKDTMLKRGAQTAEVALPYTRNREGLKRKAEQAGNDVSKEQADKVTASHLDVTPDTEIKKNEGQRKVDDKYQPLESERHDVEDGLQSENSANDEEESEEEKRREFARFSRVLAVFPEQLAWNVPPNASGPTALRVPSAFLTHRVERAIAKQLMESRACLTTSKCGLDISLGVCNLTQETRLHVQQLLDVVFQTKRKLESAKRASRNFYKTTTHEQSSERDDSDGKPEGLREGEEVVKDELWVQEDERDGNREAAPTAEKGVEEMRGTSAPEFIESFIGTWRREAGGLQTKPPPLYYSK